MLLAVRVELRPSRPARGGLRDKVLGHLGDHPGASFTQHEIYMVLSRSFVAIASVLDTFVKLGDAGFAGEKPVSSVSWAPLRSRLRPAAWARLGTGRRCVAARRP
jgi:hypothetical protein